MPATANSHTTFAFMLPAFSFISAPPVGWEWRKAEQGYARAGALFHHYPRVANHSHRREIRGRNESVDRNLFTTCVSHVISGKVALQPEPDRGPRWRTDRHNR